MINYLKINWKAIIFGFALALIISELGHRWLKVHDDAQNNVVIVALGGILEIPVWYWLDMKAADAGISFTDFRPGGGRIAVGRKTELKSDFWDWVQRTKQTEKGRCGVTLVEAISQNIKAILLYDDKEFVMFVGVPDSVVERSVNSLCELRESHAKRNPGSAAQ